MDVCVIGCGPSGLAAAKSLLEDGHRVVCLERRGVVGGLWRYVPEDPQSSCYQSLTTNTSSTMFQFSDFPFSFPTPMYPLCANITQYLEEYCTHNNLWPHIQFHSTVISITPKGSKWSVLIRHTPSVANPPTGHPQELLFDSIAICTGMFWDPKLPTWKGQDTFPGSLHHSHHYREPSPYQNKKVLVVGIGNSALDIALELAESNSNVSISTRSGTQFIQAKLATGPADVALLSRRPELGTFMTENQQTQSLFESHGMPSPKTDPMQSQYSIIKRPDRYKPLLESKRIQLRGDVVEIRGSTVYFEGGHCEDFDSIICCTGYHLQIPFLPLDILSPDVFHDNRWLSLYQGFVHPRYFSSPSPNHPGPLAFLGFLDTYANVPCVSEMQARWLGSVLSGRIPYPTQLEVSKYLKVSAERYARVQPKNPMFINYVSYMDRLANPIGAVPKVEGVKGVAETDPKLKDLVDVVLSGPAVAAQWRLNDDVGEGVARRMVAKL